MPATFLIGVDEAGYGPNLGPLVVAGTAWDVKHGNSQGLPGAQHFSHRSLAPKHFDLYAVLADQVCRVPDPDRVAIADSKSLYNSTTDLTYLEEGVLAALSACGLHSRSWTDLVDRLTADPSAAASHLPWHASWNLHLPVAACSSRIRKLTRCLSRSSLVEQQAGGCDGLEVAIHDVQAEVIHPDDFNQHVARTGLKSATLSQVSLRLLARMIDRLTARHHGAPLCVVAVCDKHGGRNFYAPLLVEAFSQPMIQVGIESRAESRYVLNARGVSLDVSFRRGGEGFLPTALASMTAKYVRELAMRALNEFWSRHVPGLRPTAGYPSDARRFRRDIAGAQIGLGIQDHVLWRER